MNLVRGHYRRHASGYVYQAPEAYSSHSRLELSLASAALVVGVGALIGISRVQTEPSRVVLSAALVGACATIVVCARGIIRSLRLQRYLSIADKVAHGGDAFRDELARLGRELSPQNQTRQLGEERIYNRLITEILADAEVSELECERLEFMDQTFAFDPDRAREIRTAAFDEFLAWVGVDLSAVQADALSVIALRLGIDQAHAEATLTLVNDRRVEREQRARRAAREAEHARQRALAMEQARRAEMLAKREREAALEAEQTRQRALEARRAREARLAARRREREQLEAQREAARAVHEQAREPVEVDVHLKRGEHCWWTGSATLRDRGNESSGTCHVSNKRLFHVGDKLVSINLSRMLDVAADPETGLLRVIKDGRKSPYAFFVDQPLVVLAHVERSLEEQNQSKRPAR